MNENFTTTHPINNVNDLDSAIAAAKTPADRKHVHTRAHALNQGHRVSHWNADGSLKHEQ